MNRLSIGLAIFALIAMVALTCWFCLAPATNASISKQVFEQDAELDAAYEPVDAAVFKKVEPPKVLKKPSKIVQPVIVDAALDLPMISGYVNSTEGYTIEEFTVIVQGEMHDFSRSNGEFSISLSDKDFVDQLQVSVFVRADGFSDSEPIQLTLESNEHRNLTFTLTPSRKIVGRVLDAESGEPVPHALILPFYHQRDEQGIRADENGYFELKSLIAERQSFKILAPGYQQTREGGFEVEGSGVIERDFFLYPKLSDSAPRSMVGIGAALFPDSEGGIVFRNLIPNAPASKILQEGDRVISVDGLDAASFDPRSLAEQIIGEEGTSVEIEIERAGENMTLTIERQRFSY